MRHKKARISTSGVPLGVPFPLAHCRIYGVTDTWVGIWPSPWSSSPLASVSLDGGGMGLMSEIWPQCKAPVCEIRRAMALSMVKI